MSKVMSQLGNFFVYLASQSPRRRELLEQVGIGYKVVTSAFEEENDFSLNPQELVKKQALGKAKGVDIKPSMYCRPILGADTVVVYQDKILGKPKSSEEAKEMLQLLSGQSHQVMTGVAIISGEKVENFVVITEVLFRDISEQEIAWYIKSGEPLDKAGAYGIQGLGALWVKEIKGSYTNVVGLPVESVFQVLKKI